MTWLHMCSCCGDELGPQLCLQKAMWQRVCLREIFWLKTSHVWTTPVIPVNIHRSLDKNTSAFCVFGLEKILSGTSLRG